MLEVYLWTGTISSAAIIPTDYSVLTIFGFHEPAESDKHWILGRGATSVPGWMLCVWCGCNRKKIRSHHLNVICYTPEQCMYPVNIASREKGIRDWSVNYLKRSLEIASQMEAPRTLITIGQGYRNESGMKHGHAAGIPCCSWQNMQVKWVPQSCWNTSQIPLLTCVSPPAS